MEHEQREAAIRENVRRFIGIRETSEIAGFSKSSLLRKVKACKFPAPVIQEGNVTRWLASEVYEWRDALIAKRDARLKARAAPSAATA